MLAPRIVDCCNRAALRGETTSHFQSSPTQPSAQGNTIMVSAPAPNNKKIDSHDAVKILSVVHWYLLKIVVAPTPPHIIRNYVTADDQKILHEEKKRSDVFF